jgi:lipid II:glycine glycyltransferase (peptidoglycan interpeptide bridge formation enzyme)
LFFILELQSGKGMKPDYKVTTSTLHEDPAWDAFVAGTPGGHHVQTSGWARVKTILGWKATRVVVTDGSQIVGGAQILIRSLPLLGSAGYVTKGPLFYQEDPDLALMVLHEIIKISRENRCQFLAIQPPNNGGYLKGLLGSLHFCASTLELAPTASLVIDLGQGPEIIMERMKRETRRNVRRSERAGITVRQGDQSDLKTFYALYQATARRQGFTPYRPEYFELLWQAFTAQGWITLLIACYENEAVSAQLLIPFGDTVIAKMAGWSGEHSTRHPNDALYWASILWAVQHGYRYFDFEGVDPEGAHEMLNRRKLQPASHSSQDTIKYGYGGKVVLYPPAYDYLPKMMLNWFYRCIMHGKGKGSLPYRLIERLRKR